MKKNRTLGYIILLLIISGFIYYASLGTKPVREEISISRVVELSRDDNIEQIAVRGQELLIDTKDEGKFTARKESDTSLFDLGIDPEKISITVEDEQAGLIWIGLLTSILPFLLIMGFLWFLMRQAQGAGNQALSFGQSKARLVPLNRKKKITFDDVAGMYEVKQELKEIVEFLKYPGKFRSIGAKVPKGALLIGSPGTGKTLLARAVAGEAGVPFFSISGSEFVEMFVGVGASRVRDLFNKAKKNAPAIIFIDEIDAVGRQRGAGLGGGHDEREQTLNQILVELDGFENETNIIVIAATNRPDVLDPALLRPGRFDRRVVINSPNIREREEILKLHAKNKPLAQNVNLGKIASSTVGFTGADLENLLNEAAIMAARHNVKKISSEDVSSALEKIVLGPERRNMGLSDNEKKITAYHEAGHALAAKLLPHGDPVHKVSIISRGQALGVTWMSPERDKYYMSRPKFTDEIAVLLAGRAAEQLIFKDFTTGAHNDLKKATTIARSMVKEYGMSNKLGPVSYGNGDMVFLGRDLHETKNYSEATASSIDLEVSRIIAQQEKKVLALLKKHRRLLKKIADKLIKEEIIEGPAFDRLFAGMRIKTA